MITTNNVLEAIGNTPLIQLRKVVPPGSAKVFVKLESANPTGSMKDRMAQAMIYGAEQDGRLPPGGTVVEYTGGSTGTSLALICAAKGYKSQIVTSDAFSLEKRNHMQALGAELTLIPSEDKQITEKLIKDMIAAADEISQQPNAYFTDQLNNVDHIAGYYPMGEEIWQQTGGQVDAFIQTVGTAASLRGVSKILREKKPGVKIFGVEPAESPVISSGETGAHKIEGIGIGFVPPLWDPSIVDEILTVSTADAQVMARRLASEEAIFAGTSSGANAVAALRIAERLGPDATVVTLMIDSGLKYLSTELYKQE